MYIEDLKEVFDADPQPQVLVVGTGYSGLMKISDEAKEAMKNRNIELIVQPTKQAYQTYNRLLGSGERAVAALHLTC